MYDHLSEAVCCLDWVICEQVGNAKEVITFLQSAPFQLQSYDSVRGLCRRCQANLDALRIAGEKAINIGRVEMEGDAEAAGVLAFLLAECEMGHPGTSEQALSLLRHKAPEICQAAWCGLRLASPRHLEPHLRVLLGKPKWDFASAAALDILAFHRLPVQVDLGEPLGGDGDEIAWLLAEAGGRIPRAWNEPRLRQFLGHPSTRVREAALRASARCGLPELPASCREATFRTNSAVMEAIEFLGVVGFPKDLSLLQRAASDPVTAKAAVSGLGRFGLPTSVPSLMDFLEVPELAECAAAAIERITGQKVPRGAPPEPPPGLSEDELDLWEPAAPLDVPRARDWWKANSGRFDPNKRWQAGLCVSDDPLGPVFDQLPLAIRYDVYLRQRALVPGTPDWELETWSWKQKNPGA